MNGRNLLFAAMVLGAVGCAGQPVGTDIHAPVAATSVSARSDSGATSRLVRPIARDFGLRPVVVFCPHDGPRGQCRYHPEPGYRRGLFYCETRDAARSRISPGSCVDAANIRAQVRHFIRWAHNQGFHEKFLFCRGSGFDWTCRDHRDPGFRRMLVFCETGRPLGTWIAVTKCFDAKHLGMPIDPDSDYSPGDITSW